MKSDLRKKRCISDGIPFLLSEIVSSERHQPLGTSFAQFLRFRPDCEGAAPGVACLRGRVSTISVLLAHGGRKRKNGLRTNTDPEAQAGNLTFTEVACSGEREWEFDLNSGLGSRSWCERAVKRQQICFWRIRVTSASCRRARASAAGRTARKRSRCRCFRDICFAG